MPVTCHGFRELVGVGSVAAPSEYEPFVNVIPAMQSISCPPNPMYRNMVIGGIAHGVNLEASCFYIGESKVQVRHIEFPEWMEDGVEIEIDFSKMTITKVIP